MISLMSNIEQFGKFILLEKLAAGGMAEVYLAKSNGANGVNKFVAVKRILPQFSKNDDFVSMFKEEAKVAINLNHSNVVSIYEFGIEKSQFYLVMEFVEGRNLRQVINEIKKINKSFSIEQAVFMIKESAAGLDHAHRCVDSQTGKPLNITHRDMSPQNIMISFEGEVKVIDFGIAKAETDAEATRAGTLKGKFAYMSPEQSEGLPVDPRTDVFALGIILWELLSNDRLFTGSNEAAILRKVRECQIPAIRKINPLVHPELERIVMKALSKDKNVRYQTAANMHKDLNRFLNTQFPDFSVEDFSSFVRDIFKQSYTEGKEKLITYSKVEIQTPTQTAPTEKINASEIPATPIVNQAKAPQEPTPDKQAAEIKGLTPEQKVKINLEGIRTAAVNKNKPIADGTQFTHLTNLQKSNSQNANLSIKNRRPIEAETSPYLLMGKLTFIAVLAMSGYIGYKNYYMLNTTNAKIETHQQNNAKNNSKNEGVIEMSATASARLSISSRPSGAKIYIDEVYTGQFTPAVVPVVANKDIKITLRKESYFPYEIVRKINGTDSLSAQLQVLPNPGYVNINVINGGSKPIVTVNGQTIDSELPIKKYAVPADIELTIKVSNSFLGLSDEKKIKVPAGKIQDIELIVGRQQK